MSTPTTTSRRCHSTRQGSLGRGYVPLWNKLASAKLKPGESIKWTNDDSVMLVKWRDRRDVYMIATDDDGLDVVR